ncbi:hypothetical protein DCC81_16580 [Chitinophaga parva]|uniref:N-acetyltransferase domain-containing protein n=1 Tax=Chitinophaga parva TaxID=2169414 RepID=A0A2T7BHV4_9BACT|nr:GNAT family N-acetyltransferase [Chitinophaga parva]PUZ25866.1 hypothetical protein DCC81_16580 [Chitinophaga parva]
MDHLPVTSRLALRPFTLADDAFIYRLLNTPTWLQFIGDRHIIDLAAARHYLQHGPLQSYRVNGFGPWLVTLRDTGAPIGMCGFFQRPFLDAPDAGLAFLPEYEGQGYASEALRACMDYAFDAMGAHRVYAFTLPVNLRCMRLLQAIGFHYQEMIRPPGEAHALMLYAIQRTPAEI